MVIITEAKSNTKVKEYIFEVVIEPDEDRYHAYFPSLSGCRTWGHTEEAYKNIQEALELYLEASIDEGDLIPGIGIVENNNDKPIFITKIESWATLNVTKSI